MQSALAVWSLLRATRRRGQEQWYSPERLAEVRQARPRTLGGRPATAPYYRAVFRDAGVPAGGLTAEALSRLPVLRNRCSCGRGLRLHHDVAVVDDLPLASGGKFQTIRPLADC